MNKHAFSIICNQHIIYCHPQLRTHPTKEKGCIATLSKSSSEPAPAPALSMLGEILLMNLGPELDSAV